MSEEKKKARLKVLKAWDETAALRRICLDPGPFKGLYTTPGQYMVIHTGPGQKGYFSLASSPEDPQFELLVKRGGGTADVLAALKEGDAIECEAPAGRGYPVAGDKGKDLLFFAAGSGIAPIRAAVRYILAHRSDYGSVYVYHGMHCASEFPYNDEQDAWKKGRVEVVRVCSRSNEDPKKLAWNGPTGHVQDVFKANPARVKAPVAYACGMKEMVKGVGEAVAGLGVEKVQQNF